MNKSITNQIDAEAKRISSKFTKADIAVMLAHSIVTGRHSPELTDGSDIDGGDTGNICAVEVPDQITLSSHFGDCKQLTTVLDNANIVASRAQIALISIRRTFEALLPMQHDKLEMNQPHHQWTSGTSDKTSPNRVIQHDINMISGLLGDREK